MTIRDDARAEAEQRSDDAFPQTPLAPENEQRADDYSDGFIAGALWASEQADREPSADLPANVTFQGDTSAESRGITHSADREPSDAAVEAAGEAIWGRGWRVPKEVVRAALIAAQEVRRAD